MKKKKKEKKKKKKKKMMTGNWGIDHLLEKLDFTTCF